MNNMSRLLKTIVQAITPPLYAQALQRSIVFSKTLHSSNRAICRRASQGRRAVTMGAVSEALNGATNGAAPTDERVEALRAQMAKANVDAYIIPTEDPHMVHMPPLLISLL